MDNSTLISAGLSTSVVAGLLIAYKVFSAIKGRRLVSDCCGKMYEVGVDVRDMPHTPDNQENPNPPSAQRVRGVAFSESQNGHLQEDEEHLGDTRRRQSEQTHLPLTVGGVATSHVSVVPTTSVSKGFERQTSFQSVRVSSLPLSGGASVLGV